MLAVTEDGRELSSRHRPGEEEALPQPAADRAKVPELASGLDSLDHDSDPDRLGELHHGGDDGRLHGVDVDTLDEGAVDFDEIHRELRQVAESGVSGAEVVDGELYPEPLQALQHDSSALGVLHGDGLGDLQVDLAGVHSRLPEDGVDLFEEIR